MARYISNNETCPVCGYRRFMLYREEDLIVDAVCPMCGYRINSTYPVQDIVDRAKNIVKQLKEEDENKIYDDFLRTGKAYVERVLVSGKEKEDV